MKKVQFSQFIHLKFTHSVQKNFVTVIVPVYKNVSGLRDTLQSLKSQSYQAKKIEVIVANDGADSEVSQLCREFKIKEVQIHSQRGSYFARNQALQESKGEFILFTDADTVQAANWIEKFVSTLKKRADYCGGNVLIDQTKIVSATNYLDKELGFPIKDSFKKMHFFPTANMATKRNVFEKLGGFDSRLLSGGDYEFGDRVFSQSKFVQKYIDNPITHPPRSYSSFAAKLKRIAHGKRVLSLLYPDRFQMLKINPFKELKSIIDLPQISPNPAFSEVSIRLLLLWFQALKAYYNVLFSFTINEVQNSKNEMFFNKLDV